MAVYPSGIKTWENKTDGTDNVLATHINDAYAEIIAIETDLGAAKGTFTTLQARADDVDTQLADSVVNVKTFGAKGDGITDDFQAIQNAIDSITKGTIWFPRGIYLIKGKQTTLGNSSRISDGLKIKSNLTFDGEGATLRQDVNCCFTFDTAIRNAITDITTNVTNIVIRNLTFDKPDATWFEHSHHINIGTCTNLLIENCKFTGWSGDAIAIGGQTDLSLSIWLQSYIENIRIINCDFDGITQNNRQGISFMTCKNVTIRDCNFKNITRSDMPGAIDFEPEYTWCMLQDINIVHNTFDNIGGSVGVITITNGYIIVVKDIIIGDNIIRNAVDEYAIAIRDANTDNINNISILNNSIDTTNRFISLEGVKLIDIKGNTIKNILNSSVWGQTIENKNINLSDNKFIDCKDVVNLTALINIYNNTFLNIENNKFINGGYTILTFFSDVATMTNIRIIQNELINCVGTTNFLSKGVPPITNILIKNNITLGKLEILSNVIFDKSVYPTELPDSIGLGTTETLITYNAAGLPTGEDSGLFVSKKYNMSNEFRSSIIQLFYPSSGTGIGTFYIRKGYNSSANGWTTWSKFTGV